jgi:hypothetical protein
MESNICSFCHQPILPQYYFCPNCGAKINSAPLSTTVGTQAWIYAFSIILPMILFIFVTRWPGVKYFKSSDRKAKLIGQIAWALLDSFYHCHHLACLYMDTTDDSIVNQQH